MIHNDNDPAISDDDAASIPGGAAPATPGEDAPVALSDDAPATPDEDAPMALGDDALATLLVVLLAIPGRDALLCAPVSTLKNSDPSPLPLAATEPRRHPSAGEDSLPPQRWSSPASFLRRKSIHVTPQARNDQAGKMH